jgi:hypothetical protein
MGTNFKMGLENYARSVLTGLMWLRIVASKELL